VIKVCDAIMGSGKSSACINYMREHPDEKYIYISPYVDEATRIKNACPSLHFYEPTKAKYETHHSKTLDSMSKIREGRNIASTHQAYAFYTQDIIDAIREQGYILMIDECVTILESTQVDPEDIRILERAGCIREVENGTFTVGDEVYSGSTFKECMRILRSRKLYHLDGDSYRNEYYYWALPAEFMMAFKEVIVMTYLFEGQDMWGFFKMNNIPYEKIGVRHDETGYHFDANATEPPPYVRALKDKIHIDDHEAINDVGHHSHALSMRWFERTENVRELKKKIYSYFRYYMKDRPASERLYGTFSDRLPSLAREGYTNSGLVFNTRATNEYADRRVLVYAANIFYDGGRRMFFRRGGVEINENLYALSTMIQWIWRSAIRNGEEIWIYIPSRRMRNMLQSWLNQLASGE